MDIVFLAFPIRAAPVYGTILYYTRAYVAQAKSGKKQARVTSPGTGATSLEEALAGAAEAEDLPRLNGLADICEEMGVLPPAGIARAKVLEVRERATSL